MALLIRRGGGHYSNINCSVQKITSFRISTIETSKSVCGSSHIVLDKVGEERLNVMYFILTSGTIENYKMIVREGFDINRAIGEG